MQQKQQKITLQQQTLRCKILPLFKTNTNVSLFPFNTLEVILQLVPYFQALKFSIDYYTNKWSDTYQPVFSFLDASYFLNYVSSGVYQIVLIFAIIFMNFYWMIQLSSFLNGKPYSILGENIRKGAFIITRNLLFLPLLNIILDLFNCQNKVPLRTCFDQYGIVLQIIGFASFVLFMLFICAQTFFNFQFLPSKKEFRRLKRSSFTSVGLLVFLVVNECVAYFLQDVAQLIALDITAALLVLLFFFKDEQLTESMKLVEMSFMGINLLGIGIVNVFTFTTQSVSLVVFFFLAVFMIGGLIQYRGHSLKFQLQNVNKWPTSQIMIRYTDTLRYYLSRKQQFMFLVFIHGYMEVHRQKCDNLTCPSRADLNDSDKKLITLENKMELGQQLLRCANVVKKIYGDGFRLTPISSDLQLQYSTFLYERGQKQLSLKNLLMIQYQELAFDRYYRYNYLKDLIHRQMCEQPDKLFLDLVSQLRVKRQQDKIIKKFEKAALVNLQFWSVLNQDHPDFQKLNDIGMNRINIRQQVRQSYQAICNIAHSQKITSLFVHYLQSIQNDEAMYNAIYKQIKQKYSLEQKIVLQDWANTSSAILLVSIQQGNYGTIIDVNSTCASYFGYQRYQILNRPLKSLFGQQLKDSINNFLQPKSTQKIIYMAHKSGYSLRIKAKTQNYNSMQTGMASIITLSIQLSNHSCFMLLDKTNKIIGVNSAIVSLLGLQLKNFQGGISGEIFFIQGMQGIQKKVIQKQKPYLLSDVIRGQFQNDLVDFYSQKMKIKIEQSDNFKVINFNLYRPKTNQDRQVILPSTFQFQVQATVTAFKFYGTTQSGQSYLSQFSQLNYAESLKKANTNKNYELGITTLRLKNNIIQVIQEAQSQQINGLKKKSGQQQQWQPQNIPRKQQQQIFQSKTSFQKFISQFKFARSINIALIIGMLVIIGIYLAYFIIFSNHNTSIKGLTSQISFQNLIIGAVTKQLSIIQDLKLIKLNVSPDTPSRVINIFKDNMDYLQSIKLKGTSTYPLQVNQGNTTQTLQSDQFILTFISYSLAVLSNIVNSKTKTQLVTGFDKSDGFGVNYLLTNGMKVKQQMINAAKVRENQIGNSINGFVQLEVIMFAAGLVLIVIIGMVLLFAIHRINQERISIFQIFLDITEIQIQQFSSKTQKFLMSLHVQDTNGQIDVEEQVQNAKKINSSTFAKKKRFKVINFGKSIYIKLLLIPIFSSAFFIHSFILSYQNLNFQANSYDYFSLTSVADYKLFSGLSSIQNSLISSTNISKNISSTYLSYYRDFFDQHYKTFGYVDPYHQAFADLLMLDICNGSMTAFDTTQILASCELPLLYPNGSYLVFTDTTMRTQFFVDSSSLTYSYYVGYQVVSKAHRKLTSFLMSAQSNLIDAVVRNLLTALIIWIIVISCIGFLYVIPIIKTFVDEVNETKNIISILPISMAKTLPLATRYFNKIIRSNKYC